MPYRGVYINAQLLKRRADSSTDELRILRKENARLRAENERVQREAESNGIPLGWDIMHATFVTSPNGSTVEMSHHGAPPYPDDPLLADGFEWSFCAYSPGAPADDQPTVVQGESPSWQQAVRDAEAARKAAEGDRHEQPNTTDHARKRARSPR